MEALAVAACPDRNSSCRCEPHSGVAGQRDLRSRHRRQDRRSTRLRRRSPCCPYPDPEFSESSGERPRTQAGLSAADFGAEGASNVLLILTDDVGFWRFERIGGPIPTPTLEALAANGLKYNAFNTTALCSADPRRPHHSGATSTGSTPASSWSAASVIRDGDLVDAEERGHSRRDLARQRLRQSPGSARITTCRPGKAAPPGRSISGPTGLGFDYFYGFLGGDVNQWDPPLFENTTPIEPKEKLSEEAKANYHLDADPLRGSGDPLDSRAARAGCAEQTVLRLLRPRRNTRAASCAERLDREVQRKIRSRLG